MRLRLLSLLVLALLGAGLLAACGGSSGGSTDNPRAKVLSFFPKDSAFVGLIQTDPNNPQIKNALALVKKFPGGGLILGRAQDSLESSGKVSYKKDVRPILGNQLAIGAASLADLNSNKIVLALVAKDKGKLSKLVDKAKKDGSKSDGDHKGYKLYRDNNTEIGVNGDTVVLGDSKAVLQSAIDKSAGGGLGESDFDGAVGSLDKNALLVGYGDATALLKSPRAQKAITVPWVAALKKYAFAASATSQGLKLGFRLDTSGKSLQEADLPMASGPQPPEISSATPLRVGLRDPAHTLEFAQAVAKIVNPSSFGQFSAAKSVIRGRTKVDLDKDLVGGLAGSAIVRSDLSKFVFSSDLLSPAAMRTTLARLAPLAANAIEGAGLAGAKVSKAGNGFYTVSQAGRAVGAYGVVGQRFVAGNASVADVRSAGTESVAPAQGAKGALAAVLQGQLLRKLIASGANLGPLALALGSIGDINGWVSADTKQLLGEFTLAVG